MLQLQRNTIAEQDVYTFIGDAGAVTPVELAAFCGIDERAAGQWLRKQAAAGYLHAGGLGAYATSCPWPRVGW